MKELWYKTWFNSKYYHILYQHRDAAEAANFLDNLIVMLQLEQPCRIIDIGCGKGRHAIHLNDRGFEVQGIDLSEHNIHCARANVDDGLSFEIHDMRNVFKESYYDCVLNLFTSFGYFDDDEDDFKSLCAMAGNLKQGGLLVLDYLNTSKVESEVYHNDRNEVVMEGITFQIEKKLKGKFIEKFIDITDGNEKFHFTERVKTLRSDDFIEYLEKAGFTINKIYGDYFLNEYDAGNSDRMIFIAQKL